MFFKKHNVKRQIILMLLPAAGLLSFKLKQQNESLQENRIETKLDDQLDSIKKPDKKTVTFISDTATNAKPAQFPGGFDGWRRYLETNLKYPKKAQKHGTQSVVKEIKPLNDLGDGLTEEAVRVIKDGPNWKPAMIDGKYMSYRFVQTITFALQ